MKRSNKSGSGGANWMDTYGDMVTLMLCFFVMLYSMSTMDQQKWEQLVEALNPSSVEDIQNVVQNLPANPSQGDPSDTASAVIGQLTQEDVEQDLEELYQAILQYVQQSGIGSKVTVGKGNGYVFISFDDTVFFNGDSYQLLDAGKETLDQVGESIREVSASVDEIRVLGHTAQANPSSPNDPTFDRFLASNRATVVTVYLQEKGIVAPSRIVSVGYGQWRPVAQNDTTEGRAENRRVELIVTGLDLEDGNGDDITKYYTMRDDAGVPAESGAIPPEAASAAPTESSASVSSAPAASG
ncbi:OmpA/MotB family protein [Anaeromassilibacillus sp. An200]|uniref:Flagellar motor protein MotB n=1 Tax=Candidatus Caccousia stercoris TaxID=2840723 RepID=A0A9D1FQH3_9FIRM|nr:flagellar motor protein MotB [Anaeromassilibacillus sp. An200]OUP10570.1 hypothetical protein B5F35_11305 [Anaeromassilibacillus sp. An200]HIS78136.1 flagellar motor protein MotB [Candidatus Caccousia stercoris]